MDIKIILEQDILGKAISISNDNDLFYIKLVGIGPNALKEHSNKPSDVIEKVYGFYVVGSKDKIENSIIDIVHNAFEHRRKQNG